MTEVPRASSVPPMVGNAQAPHDAAAMPLGSDGARASVPSVAPSAQMSEIARWLVACVAVALAAAQRGAADAAAVAAWEPAVSHIEAAAGLLRAVVELPTDTLPVASGGDDANANDASGDADMGGAVGGTL